ncbi:MAG: hypothetical protein IJS36_03100 [Kiritimatiellae bacterium]|nr:hypothetical protein [Kiritimatiellia bacterium]MBQ7234376.1 hypothetical protein [Kiritimatiellia bacterium]
MNIRKTLCAAAVFGCVAAATAADEVAEAEKGEVEETPIVSAEFGLQLDSKYMTYGVVDGKDPILTPSAQLTFFDWAYVGVESIFDLTKGNGKRGEYGNRAGRWTTLDAIVGLAHEFELTEDIGLSVDANYIYEYIRRYHSDMGDTQYINLEFGLTGLWLEPTLAIERDLMADDGTYVNFSLAHTFTLVGDDDDPTLTFTPSVGQGFGDKHRTRGYGLADDHAGLMDTTIMGEFEWALCDYVALTAYVAYSDYWFDSKLRHGAREYNGAWSHGSKYADSWNFYGGVGVTVSF